MRRNSNSRNARSESSIGAFDIVSGILAALLIIV